MKKKPRQAAKRPSIKKSTISPAPFVFIYTNRSFVKIFLSDLHYLESAENYVKFHTATGTYLSLCTLKKLVEQLPRQQFCRINRSIIVNINCIKLFNRDTVILLNGKDFAFGENCKKELHQRIKVL